MRKSENCVMRYEWKEEGYEEGIKRLARERREKTIEEEKY